MGDRGQPARRRGAQAACRRPEAWPRGPDVIDDTSTRILLRYVYRLDGADALPANFALKPFLAGLADDQPGVEFRKTEAFAIVEEAQVRARAAGCAGDIWADDGVGAGPFVSLSPGKLTGGGTGILALYWTVSGEATTYVVSAVLLPYLGMPFRTEGFELRSPEFLRDIRDRLDGPRVPNLGETHELLHESWDGGGVVEQLVAWEDDVQMGVMSWEEFCDQARRLIDDHG